MWQKLTSSVAITLVLAGCGAGVKVSTDFNPQQDFSSYQTYIWAAPPQTGNARLDSELTQRRIQSAVDEVLGSKGLRPATGNEQPDFMVGYYAALDSRVDVQTVNTYSGWGWGPYYGGGYYGGVYATTQARYYNQGTLIIDIADAEKKELVWRGTGESEVHTESNPERRQARLVDAVQQIMRGFPPKAKN